MTPQIGTATSDTIVTNVLSRLRSDSISRIVKSDKTIMALAKKLCQHLGDDTDQHFDARQNLRRVGRLLQQLRIEVNSPDKALIDFINPQSFRIVCSSCRAISRFDGATNRYKTQSLAQRLGPMLDKICDILLTDSIEHQDTVLQQNVTDFRKLYELNWSDEVSVKASKTLAETRRKKDSSSILPLADDVKVLSNYLEKTAKTNYDILIGTPTPDGKERAWEELSKAVLTHTILFSRRRAGEVSKMTLSDYERRRTADVDGPVAATLTKLEQKLCTVFKRTLVKGKRGRPVPVIFTKQMEQYIDCLILHRAGLVDDDNLYLFARVTPSLEHIRGTDAMRESANACGAERPDTLRSTTLRKQIATLSQVMNLQENELDVLATFLGHDIRVHRKYYRLADETIQVAKVAKLLMNMEKGGQGLLPGQTLDSLDIEGQEIAATGGMFSNIKKKQLFKGTTEDHIRYCFQRNVSTLH